jgi:hypothetical protein
VTGAYAGQVKLEGVFQGVYTDTTATPTTMDLGQIDLALNLSQTSNAVSGYIVLEQTLVYSQEHTITVTPVGSVPLPGTPTPAPQQLVIGPLVHGTFDGTILQLESDQFSQTVGGLQITRQFSLSTTGVNSGSDDSSGHTARRCGDILLSHLLWSAHFAWLGQLMTAQPREALITRYTYL